MKALYNVVASTRSHPCYVGWCSIVWAIKPEELTNDRALLWWENPGNIDDALKGISAALVTAGTQGFGPALAGVEGFHRGIVGVMCHAED